MEASTGVDPAMLPLPEPVAASEEHPVEYLSVIFNQREPNQMLRISRKATTPMWLGKKMYEKLHADIKYELKPMADSPSLVFINVSPIEYGHVLLVPRVLDFLPQQCTPETVTMCLAFVKASDNPYFRAGFNSLPGLCENALNQPALLNSQVTGPG